MSLVPVGGFKNLPRPAPPSANAGLGTGLPGQVFLNGNWQSPPGTVAPPAGAQPINISNRTDLGGAPGTMVQHSGPSGAPPSPGLLQRNPAPTYAGATTPALTNNQPVPFAAPTPQNPATPASAVLPQNTPRDRTGMAGSAPQAPVTTGSTTAGTSFTPNPSPTGSAYPTPSTGNAMAGSVLQQFEQGRQSANQANEGRYQDILGQYNQLAGSQSQAIGGVAQEFQDIAGAYGKRTNDLSQMLKGFGDTQREDLQSQYGKATSGLQQSMINRGLTNSTAFDSAMRGAGQDYNRNSRALEDSLTRQQMDYMGKLTGEELQSRTLAPNARMDVAKQTFDMGQQPLAFMERKTDTGPSMSDVANFSNAVGAGAAANPNYLSALGDTGQTVGYGGTGTNQTAGAVSARSPTSPGTLDQYQSPNTSPYQVRSNMAPSLGSGILAGGGSIASSQMGGGGGGGGGGGSRGGGGGGGGGVDVQKEESLLGSGKSGDPAAMSGYNSIYDTATQGGYSGAGGAAGGSEVQSVNPKTGKLESPAGYTKDGKPFYAGDNPDPSQIDPTYKAGPWKPEAGGQKSKVGTDVEQKAAESAGLDDSLFGSALDWLKARGTDLVRSISDGVIYASAPENVQKLIDSFRKMGGK